MEFKDAWPLLTAAFTSRDLVSVKGWVHDIPSAPSGVVTRLLFVTELTISRALEVPKAEGQLSAIAGASSTELDDAEL